MNNRIAVKYRVLESSSFLKTVQTIYSPKSLITKLKWSGFHPEIKNQKYINKLACADDSGNVSVWNPLDAKLVNEYNDSNYLTTQKINGTLLSAC